MVSGEPSVGSRYKENLKDVFYPRDQKWQEKVLFRGKKLLRSGGGTSSRVMIPFTD